jgi:hypothetical protein
MQEPLVNAIAAVARERGGQFNDAFTATSRLVAEYGERRSELSRDGEPIQLTLDSTRVTPRGLQCMIFRPRA